MMNQLEFGATSEESQDAVPNSGGEDEEYSRSNDAFQSPDQNSSIVQTEIIPNALTASSRNSSRTSIDVAVGDAFR